MSVFAEQREWKTNPFSQDMSAQHTWKTGSPFSKKVDDWESKKQTIPIDTTMTVSGIWSNRRSFRAMIGEQIVKEGQTVGNVMVRKILKDEVIVSNAKGQLRRIIFK